ncbi:hypothetical protein BDV98DRAFT_596403 [Pterulicium gracile]|uniref:Uncharacterized protein n=1 Tax=Pterulicium gracile TaxID=1884261 RepID=A0A5C3Q6A8_9AGAR|nr:hypothetical protein BDV98DRAFT_596403 [Pterula gracilis]
MPVLARFSYRPAPPNLHSPQSEFKHPLRTLTHTFIPLYVSTMPAVRHTKGTDLLAHSPVSATPTRGSLGHTEKASVRRSTNDYKLVPLQEIRRGRPKRVAETAQRRDGTDQSVAVWYCFVPGCDKHYSRRNDFYPRNLPHHLSWEHKQQCMYFCPFKGCEYSGLQLSNFKTHMKTQDLQLIVDEESEHRFNGRGHFDDGDDRHDRSKIIPAPRFLTQGLAALDGQVGRTPSPFSDSEPIFPRDADMAEVDVDQLVGESIGIDRRLDSPLSSDDEGKMPETPAESPSRHHFLSADSISRHSECSIQLYDNSRASHYYAQDVPVDGSDPRSLPCFHQRAARAAEVFNVDPESIQWNQGQNLRRLLDISYPRVERGTKGKSGARRGSGNASSAITLPSFDSTFGDAARMEAGPRFSTNSANSEGSSYSPASFYRQHRDSRLHMNHLGQQEASIKATSSQGRHARLRAILTFSVMVSMMTKPTTTSDFRRHAFSPLFLNGTIAPRWINTRTRTGFGRMMAPARSHLSLKAINVLRLATARCPGLHGLEGDLLKR